jgi:hypothetical protein
VLYAPLQDAMAQLLQIRLFAAIMICKSLLPTVTLVSLLALFQCHGVFARSHSLRRDELHSRQLEAAKRYSIDNLLKAQQTTNLQQDDASTSTRTSPSAIHWQAVSSNFMISIRILTAISRVLRRWQKDTVSRLGRWS